MRSLSGWGLGFLLATVVCSPMALAVDRYVAISGNNTWPGTSSQPYRTIKYALSQANSGDIIHVRAGTYAENWISMKSGVTVRSADGPRAAKVSCTTGISFLFYGCSNAEVDGLEVYATYGGGSATDGLVRAYSCDNIRIRNMSIHDAPNDADCVKIGGSGFTTTNILLENCEIYNPAKRTTGYQECVDIYPANYVTVRGCWIYHTPTRQGDTLIYAKGGSTNILWENNVFGPRYGDPYGNASTSAGAPSPTVFPSCSDFIARNNLFLDCSGDAAFGLLSARNVEFYNNVIWNYTGTRTPIEFWTVGTGRNENFKFYNNIVCGSNGTAVFQDRGTYIPLVFQHDYNIYYDVAGGGSVNIYAEANSLFQDPQLVDPATPVLGTDTWATIVPRFNLLAGSPAINEGYNLGSLVTTDILGTARPQGSAYDIGAFEYVALNQDPAVDAGADVSVYENQAVSLHAVGDDPDGDDLTYAWTRTAGKDVPLTGANTADLSFTSPSLGLRSDGLMTFEVVVDDGRGGTATDSVNVTVYMAGDANRDWYVNVGDLQQLVAAWGSQKTPPSANWDANCDFNGDGYVNVGDLQVLVGNWARNLSM